MAKLNSRKPRAILYQDPLQWVIIDKSANVKYIVVFTLCRYKNGELDKNVNQLAPDSVQYFEWTNEANNLYLTGKLIVSDAGNLIPKYYNTFTGLHVVVEKRKHIPKENDDTLLSTFEHDFIVDKISIDNQQLKQFSNNHVLVYTISLKSLHAMKLFAHGEFSNWGSSELDSGNYSPDETESEGSGSMASKAASIMKNGVAGANTFGTELTKKLGNKMTGVVQNLKGKLKTTSLISKLTEWADDVNSAVAKLESLGASIGGKSKANSSPVKIYEIIHKILEKALNEGKETEQFEFLNFEEVFAEAHPKMKFCLTKKDTIIDAIHYLQQKLFSLKLPHRLTMSSDNGLSYISYDEFEKNFKVVYFKDIESFRANTVESSIELIQGNGGTGLMRFIKKDLLKIKIPRQSRFTGMIDYFTNFYHELDYELLEDSHPKRIDFTKPSKKDEKIDYAEGIDKVPVESNEKLQFLCYDEKFEDFDKNGEQNTKSFGTDLFYEIEDEEARPFIHIFSEDFDNNSYLKLLEAALFKNVVTIEFSGNFFDVPGMTFKLTLDDAGNADGDYYSQLNNSLMHITKVTHIFKKMSNLREGDSFVGEELTLCKI